MSTPANATVWAIRGQLLNVSGDILNPSTGNPITAGLTGLQAYISKDDGAYAATVNTPVEHTLGGGLPAPANGWTGPGTWTLDLTAAEMTCTKAIVIVTASNSSAVFARLYVNTLTLSEVAGRADSQAVLLLEQYLLQCWAADINQQDCPTSLPGTHVLYKHDGTPWLTGQDSLGASGSPATRGKLS